MTKMASLAALGAIVLAGCTLQEPPVAALPAPDMAEESRTQKLASALLDAHEAERRADRPALGEALRRLDALGANPVGDAAQKDMRRWAALAPSDMPPMRGRALGPGFRAGNLAPAGSRVFEQTFLAGKRASIVATTKGGMAIGLEVAAAETELLCQRTAPRSSCSWTPLYTRRHTITLTNPGRKVRHYYLVID